MKLESVSGMSVLKALHFLWNKGVYIYYANFNGHWNSAYTVVT